MNKNEENQFKIFKLLVENNEKVKEDLLYNLKSVEKLDGNGAYDAFGLDKYNMEKYVQLCTMSNLVAISGTKIMNGKKYLSSKKVYYDLKKEEKQASDLEKAGIKREILNADENQVITNDKFENYGNEENLDEKYGVKTAGLLNALIRILEKKINKYGLPKKQKESILVVIDESNNCIFEVEKNKDENKLIFFNYILKLALEHVNFEDSDFFDKVQIYFKVFTKNRDVGTYYIANTYQIESINFSDYMENIKNIIVVPFSNYMSFDIKITK